MSRRVLVVLAIALPIIGILIFVSTHRQASMPASPSEIQFTDAVTGQTVNDIVGEDNSLEPGVVDRPYAAVDNIETIYNLLTTSQASNAQTTINNFLMAHSGLSNVHAGIKANTITKTDTQLVFTMVVQKPQASYTVTITTINTDQTIPTVTFKQAE